MGGEGGSPKYEQIPELEAIATAVVRGTSINIGIFSGGCIVHRNRSALTLLRVTYPFR
jgi:hypothetical protein